jgi:hypothetical protein
VTIVTKRDGVFDMHLHELVPQVQVACKQGYKLANSIPACLEVEHKIMSVTYMKHDNGLGT